MNKRINQKEYQSKRLSTLIQVNTSTKGLSSSTSIIGLLSSTSIIGLSVSTKLTHKSKGIPVPIVVNTLTKGDINVNT